MSKQAANSPDAPKSPASIPLWKWIVSLLVVLHVTAVFIAPFSFASSSGPGMASPFASTVMGALRPYIDAAFLNHGYFFFAPNPGPSHLVRYRVEFDDGRPPVTGEFPHLPTQQPRLFYHRHFMLSEQMHSLFTPPQPPADSQDPLALAQWRDQRKRYQSVWKSFERHLLAKHGGDRIQMVRVEHRLLDVPEVLQGKRLTATDTYRVLPEDRAAPTGPRGDASRPNAPPLRGSAPPSVPVPEPTAGPEPPATGPATPPIAPAGPPTPGAAPPAGEEL